MLVASDGTLEVSLVDPTRIVGEDAEVIRLRARLASRPGPFRATTGSHRNSGRRCADLPSGRPRLGLAIPVQDGLTFPVGVRLLLGRQAAAKILVDDIQRFYERCFIYSGNGALGYDEGEQEAGGWAAGMGAAGRSSARS